jgi:predicted MFS family arabinose efflux permease
MVAAPGFFYAAARGNAKMVDSSPGGSAPLVRRAPVPLLALGTFAIGTDVFAIAGILPLIAAGLGIGIGAAAQINAAYALAYALGSPLLAVLSAPWRKERLVVVALGGFAVADLICAGAGNFAMLLGGRVLSGLFAALYVPTALTLAAALAPAGQRGTRLSGVNLGTSTALILGVPLGTWLGQHFGWPSSFLLGGACAAVAMLALAGYRLQGTPPPPALPLRARLEPLARPGVALALLAQLLWSSCNYSIYHYSAVLLGGRVGLPAMPQLLFSAGLGTWVGAFAGGRLADRFGAARPIVAIAGANALNIALLPLTGGTLLGADLAMFLFGIAGWAVIPAQQSRLLGLAPENGGVVIALLSSTVYVGSAVGAAWGGFVLGHAGAAVLAPAAGAGILLGILLFLGGGGLVRRSSSVA